MRVAAAAAAQHGGAGARPMQIDGSVERPIPAAFYQEIKLAAG